MDLDEVRALSDRIAVMYAGRIAAELSAGASEAELGPFMLGGPSQPARRGDAETAAAQTD